MNVGAKNLNYFLIYMHAPTQRLANQNAAAYEKAHGVDSLNSGRKCTELGPHLYASSLLQPYR